MELLIKNAKYYANNTFFEGDILVEGGKIASIMAPGSYKGQSDKTIDAAGLCVLPGIVDSHVHFREPGRTDREDFFTGSVAAAAGGVTTYCEMPIAYPPPYSVEVLENRIKLAEEKSVIDMAFYGSAGYENRGDFQKLIDAGVIAFKTFLHPAPEGREGEFIGLTVNDDGQLYMMLKAAGETDGRYSFHCENHTIIKSLENYLHENCVNDYSFHYKSRPNIAEIESVATIIKMAEDTGAKVEIVHISAPEACQMVKEAQAKGLDILAETCFHYLAFDTSHIDKYGPYAKCNPPLRTREDVEKLWTYVKDGTITMVGSDHAPFTKEEKEIGVREGIWKAYSGMPAIELLLPLMLKQVNEGRLTLVEMIKLISENTAKNFGLFPQKGCIAVGSDADFAILDLNHEYTIKVEDMKSKAKDINLLFDGIKVKGKAVYTIVRGNVIMENGVVHEENRGYGKYVPRRVK